MPRHRLYKYFDKLEYAEGALNDGTLMFSSLPVFRDYEDAEVRRDHNEGTSVFKPPGGLTINNLTQKNTFTLSPNHVFKSSVKLEDIFVFCLSRSLTEEMRSKFKAVACLEIKDVKAFCARVEAALPNGASVPGSPRRKRIGKRVEYYRESEGPNPRWAVPEIIATSKLDRYAWQDEFRLIFTMTDALDFQKVVVKVAPDSAQQPKNIAEHQRHLLRAGTLHDICNLHKFLN